MESSVRKDTEDLISFIGRNPSAYHTVDSIRRDLLGCGFEELDERKRFSLRRGHSYLMVRKQPDGSRYVLPFLLSYSNRTIGKMLGLLC